MVKGTFSINAKQLTGLAILSFEEKPLNYEFILSASENQVKEYNGKNQQTATINITNSTEK
jgi:hypothetical protein